MTDLQILAATAAGLGALKLVLDLYRATKATGSAEAGQLASLQLQQVQAAAAQALASSQLEARLVRQIDALTAQVSALTQTVADLTRDTDERLRKIEAEADADRRSVGDALAKLGKVVDRALLAGGHPSDSGDQIPAVRPGRYPSGRGSGGE